MCIDEHFYPSKSTVAHSQNVENDPENEHRPAHLVLHIWFGSHHRVEHEHKSGVR